MQLDNCNKNILSCYLLSKYISHVEKHTPVINTYHNSPLSLSCFLTHTHTDTHTHVFM